ncbi:coiled-coil domain-containing protein 15 [Aplysia californica]|uniref:Coiled-coil domain-containing protein 15 n=1 Tax=Aplysia californica TaxID=6500 RepID=A0ABM0J9Y4_APLCA|nr:coiled-coil domain-containing protein 15 [Aplysia californica]
MAARQRRPVSSSGKFHGREVMRPVVSTDIMGNRNVEVVPVGAWVEPADDDVQPDAVMAAKEEEEKIRRMQEEKENRLKSFQQRVKQRVSQASRLKRQQQIQEAEQAFEQERRVVQQSCLTAENSRKDTCLHRQDLDLAIRNRLFQKYGEDMSTWEKDSVPAFISHSDVSHEVMDKARQQLMSKKLSTQPQRVDPTPASSWGRVTRDIQTPTVRNMVSVEELQTSAGRQINKIHGAEEGEEEREWEDRGCFSEEEYDREDKAKDRQKDFSEDSKRTQMSVQFDVEEHSGRHRRKKRPDSSRRQTSARMQALLSQESESDILARQRRQQAAVSRRVFMDREREAVRENIRRQQHRKKIVSLKKEKEEYRQELEEMAQRELEPTDPDTGETAEERRLREKLEALEVKAMVDQRKDQIQRTREMERYLGALRHSLIEKVSRRGMQLPALCACGDSVWDTNPETCANNCFFYRNHRAYARALQSLLSSAEVM